MARLPIIGSDVDNWGGVLNEFLRVSHHEDGRLRGAYKVINVQDFGAIGDGSANDTAAIQTAVAAAAAIPGAAVWFPPGLTFKLIGPIIIPVGTNGLRLHASGATIHQTTADAASLVGLGVSNIEVQGGRWQGPGQAAFSDPNQGTLYFSRSGNLRSADIRMLDVEVFNTGGCVSVDYCDRLWIQRCTLHDYAGLGAFGIQTSCSTAFNISHNRIYNGAGPTSPVYGITATGDTAAGHPQYQCAIIGNHISDIPSWAGIMTHEVSDLVIVANVIRNVRSGIHVGQFMPANVIERVVIAHNDILATTTDTWAGGSAIHVGILARGLDANHRIRSTTIVGNIIANFFNIAGAPTFAGAPGCISVGHVDDCTVVGNVISGVGAQANKSIGLSVSGVVNQLSIGSNTLSGEFGIPIYFINATVNACAISGSVINDTNTINPSPSILAYTGTAISRLALGANTTTARTLVAAQNGGAIAVVSANPLGLSTLVDAAVIMVDASTGSYFTVTLGGNRQVGVPSNPMLGQRITFTIIQDGAGNHTLTWDPIFKVTWSDAGNSAGKRASVSFLFDGVNWNQEGAQAGYV